MPKERSIDLHGYTVQEAIGVFIGFYNQCVREGFRGPIEVVHGYGSSGQGGAIQQQLWKYMGAHSERFASWIPGDRLGNPGVTRVYPHRALPSSGRAVDVLSSPIRDAILKQCETPRAKEKVITKLCGRFGERNLKEEIAKMVRDGQIYEEGGRLQSKRPSIE